MRRIDARFQREFRRAMNERHWKVIISALFTLAVALALLGHVELAICTYVATGFGLSVVFREIYRRVQGAEKTAKAETEVM